MSTHMAKKHHFMISFNSAFFDVGEHVMQIKCVVLTFQLSPDILHLCYFLFHLVGWLFQRTKREKFPLRCNYFFCPRLAFRAIQHCGCIN